MHPYLIRFAADANWISPDEFTFLINPHSHYWSPGSRRVIQTNPRKARRFAELHQRILDSWEREMA